MSTSQDDREALHEVLNGLWEYNVLTGVHGIDLLEKSNEMGARHWEMVGFCKEHEYYTLMFKRRRIP